MHEPHYRLVTNVYTDNGLRKRNSFLLACDNVELYFCLGPGMSVEHIYKAV